MKISDGVLRVVFEVPMGDGFEVQGFLVVLLGFRKGFECCAGGFREMPEKSRQMMLWEVAIDITDLIREPV